MRNARLCVPFLVVLACGAFAHPAKHAWHGECLGGVLKALSAFTADRYYAESPLCDHVVSLNMPPTDANSFASLRKALATTLGGKWRAETIASAPKEPRVKYTLIVDPSRRPVANPELRRAAMESTARLIESLPDEAREADGRKGEDWWWEARARQKNAAVSVAVKLSALMPRLERAPWGSGGARQIALTDADVSMMSPEIRELYRAKFSKPLDPDDVGPVSLCQSDSGSLWLEVAVERLHVVEAGAPMPEPRDAHVKLTAERNRGWRKCTEFETVPKAVAAFENACRDGKPMLVDWYDLLAVPGFQREDYSPGEDDDSLYAVDVSGIACCRPATWLDLESALMPSPVRNTLASCRKFTPRILHDLYKQVGPRQIQNRELSALIGRGPCSGVLIVTVHDMIELLVRQPVDWAKPLHAGGVTVTRQNIVIRVEQESGFRKYHFESTNPAGPWVVEFEAKWEDEKPSVK